MAALGLGLHHVSLAVTDIDQSRQFYQQLFGLDLLVRPPFDSVGVWFAVGPLQLHLIEYQAGSFRRDASISTLDGHFAFNTPDFEGFIAHATALGFREDAADGNPRRLLMRREGPAGFPQVYLLDPDNNIIEVNGAP
ncbi:MAG: lactoylglutathione lyase [Hyphomicrobiales bacterium]|nr:MAG: lactoylglutathione lyase [Hyphomicrobiales bacterium]